MSSGANVNSIQAIQDFRAELSLFSHEASEAMISFDLEVRRSVEWLCKGLLQQWQNELKKCEEAVTASKNEFFQCRANTLPGGGQPACLEEKKKLERAKQRQQYAEEKIKTVIKWGHVAEREATEYKGRANQLTSLFESDLPRAIAQLDRALSALEAYTAVSHASTQSVLGDDVRPADGPSFAQPLPIEPPPSGEENEPAAADAAAESVQEGASGANSAHTTDSTQSAT